VRRLNAERRIKPADDDWFSRRAAFARLRQVVKTHWKPEEIDGSSLNRMHPLKDKDEVLFVFLCQALGIRWRQAALGFHTRGRVQAAGWDLYRLAGILMDPRGEADYEARIAQAAAALSPFPARRHYDGHVRHRDGHPRPGVGAPAPGRRPRPAGSRRLDLPHLPGGDGDPHRG
jgi:hypothetical protein